MQNLEKGIIENLPQIPYIVDQVGEAMKWLKEEVDEDKYREYLVKTLKVSEYARSISEANFYKYHLVIASLLLGLGFDPTTDSKFSIFDSPSKSIENAFKMLTEDPETVQKRGCFNALSMHLAKLARDDQDLLNIILIFILCDLEELKAGIDTEIKAPITKDDYINLLGYAYVILNLEVSKLNLLNKTQETLNKIRIILNSMSF